MTQDDIFARLLEFAGDNTLVQIGIGIAIGAWLLSKIDGEDAGTNVDDIMTSLEDISEDIERVVDAYMRTRHEDD